MATNRKLVFVNGELYHVFNRGIEKRLTFTNNKELFRAKELLKFYRYQKTFIRFSQFNLLPENRQKELWNTIVQNDKCVEIISYCLMPNHFHFLLRQLKDKGITNFISNFTNAYTKYFNTKHQRVGPLFEGTFKAVYVEDDEQLIHLTRYIHLNPVASSLIKANQLNAYLWSLYPEYMGENNDNIVDKQFILNMFKSREKYESFILDQVNYSKELEKIKHKILE